ncbi:serine/threonine-protein kinase [Streptomyces sp. NPDC048442]|uniref:serine/threonine-protein kinase n=1 Tax=Streptomyces sp. NPDC048442 TaxID=3154823 RepID=UPI003440739F
MDDDHGHGNGNGHGDGQGLGQLLAGRYRLTGLLGQGGMGAVWRAHDEQLGREVAVKELRLPAHLGSAERANWIARLDREARAAARLKHPGIVTVHDRIAGADGLPWIVMEWVTGGSLDDLLQNQGPLSPQHVADIGQQVAAALSAAHRMGITHRDIKPANILLEDGRAVLTDFGIAALEGDATLTATGMIMGTPAFMAPEQVRGLPATAESDLWSLGATLYTAVEGHPPFAGSAPSAVLVAVATEAPAPVVRAGPLAPALEGLLRKDPAARSTMEELRAQLGQLTDQRPAPPISPAPPMPPAPTASPASPAGPAYSPTARVQPPTQPSAPTPAPPPSGSAQWPTAPAGTPAVPRRRISRRAARIGATMLLVAVVSTVFALYAARETAEYQDRLRAAENMGSPSGFTVKSKTPADNNRVTVVYQGGPEQQGDPLTANKKEREAVETWLRVMPGVEGIGDPDRTPVCMFAPDGCEWPVRLKDDYTDPAIVHAQLQTRGGRYELQVEVGRPAD